MFVTVAAIVLIVVAIPIMEPIFGVGVFVV
jgi:hypothetical protein